MQRLHTNSAIWENESILHKRPDGVATKESIFAEIALRKSVYLPELGRPRSSPTKPDIKTVRLSQ